MMKLKQPNRLRSLTATLKTVAAIAGIALCMAAGPGVRTADAQKLPTATAPGAYIAIGGTYSGFQAEYPQRVLGGAGGYIDLNIRRHLGIEGEARWLRQNQIAGSHETTYLVGPRFELHRGRFSPYAKALVGDGKLVFPYGDGYGNYVVVAGGGGLDVNISENFKVRAIDFEYQDWPRFNFGAGTGIYPINPYGISVGLSYRIYHSGGWPRHRYK